jgi:hypothetical protein
MMTEKGSRSRTPTNPDTVGQATDHIECPIAQKSVAKSGARVTETVG